MREKTEYLLDLHVHGKHARATSKNLTIPMLERYARIKGIHLLGTGDFTHPLWIKHLKEELREDETESGIYHTKTGFPFVFQTEISLVYTQKKGRRIHTLVLAPNLNTAERITDWLKTRGRVDYDGRPIFKIPSPEFVESLREIDERIEVIPAHIWTPWFGLLGSKSGFDSVKECFLDQTKNIHALETGISSDPAMNWRLSQLDKFNMVSFSDLHSYWPWRLGREATRVLLPELNYDTVLRAIRSGIGLTGTIETDPAYGKYHFDGHRTCAVSLAPTESNKINNICPSCQTPLTIGVQNRVEELADRPEGYTPKNRPGFVRVIPLTEIIVAIHGEGLNGKKTWETYYEILKLGSEMDILLKSPFENLIKHTDAKLAQAIIDIREGRITIQPGYDGVYGKIIVRGIPTAEDEDECLAEHNTKSPKKTPAMKKDYHRTMETEDYKKPHATIK